MEARIIGWREWLALPELGIDRIKAKVDTGARTSCLHAYDVEKVTLGGEPRVRFKVHPLQRTSATTVEATAALVEERWIRSSSGVRTFRPVIETIVALAGESWPIQVTLIRRDHMGFRMLLGREAVRRRFVVDPGRSYLVGKKPRPRRRKGKKQ